MNGPALRERYDASIDEREHSVDEWKQLIYKEVREYESTHLWTATSSSTNASASLSPSRSTTVTNNAKSSPVTTTSASAADNSTRSHICDASNARSSLSKE